MKHTHTRMQTNSKLKRTALLLAFFFFAYLLPLGARDLFVPDETRYAEIAREMLATGDWIVPHVNGLRYFEKPIMGYWIHAASLFFFGENSFAVRLPSALAVGLSALLIFVLVRHVSKKEEHQDVLPFLATLIYLSCFEVFGVGNTAVLDSLFSFFLTATIIAFYFATEAAPGSAKETGLLLLSGIGCGMAFLTKGFLALALPVLSLTSYLIWQRRYLDLIRMSWLPILTAVIVALPWSIIIHLKEPDFWPFFFWNEHIRRFLAENAQHRESFVAFILRSLAMFVPWTFVAPASGFTLRLSEPWHENRIVKFCLCWLVLPFLFFSISKGKLLTYILPCFPPFAIVIAFGLLHALKKEERNKLFNMGVGLIAVMFTLIIVAFLYVQVAGFRGFRPYTESWKAVMAVNSLIFFIVFCFWSIRSRNGETKLLLLGMAPVLLFFFSHYLIPSQTLEVKAPGSLLKRHGLDIPSDSVIISDENSILAVCWYLRRSDVYLLGWPGELDYGLKYNDAKDRLLDVDAAIHLIHHHPGKTYLIARIKNVSRWRDQLPEPVFQDQNGPSGYIFWKY